jgi:hypothetical protein
MLNSLKLYSKYFLKSAFSPESQFVVQDMKRFFMKKEVFRQVKNYSEEEKKQSLDYAIDWLINAQKANPDGGMGSYHLFNKWSSSYPETTGYIIPTLIDYGKRYNHPEAIGAAKKAAEFLQGIQKESGGW